MQKKREKERAEFFEQSKIMRQGDVHGVRTKKKKRKRLLKRGGRREVQQVTGK